MVATARCFGTPAGWRSHPVADWLRTPAVQAALAPRWTRCGGPRSTGSCPSGRPPAGTGRARGRWSTPGSGTGSSRGWPAPCSASAGRLLLVLDNLQWCDQETLAFLTFCLRPGARRAGDGRRRRCATTIATASPGLGEWLRPDAGRRAAHRAGAGPLGRGRHRPRSPTAIAVAPLAGPTRRCCRPTTGGFPLFVVEAARAAGDRAGARPVGDLAAVLRNRFEQVSAAAREVAGLAAAVGRDFTLDLLTEASDLDADDGGRTRSTSSGGGGSCASSATATTSPTTCCARRPTGQVGPPQRWLLHRRIAQGLELLHADDTDEVAAQLAEQYARGGRGERALGYYRRAAEVAAGVFAHAEAIRLHKQALAVVRAHAGRSRQGRPGAGGARGHGRTAQRPVRLLLRRAAADAGTVDRARPGARPQGRLASGLVALNTSQFVQGRDRGQHTGRRSGRWRWPSPARS